MKPRTSQVHWVHRRFDTGLGCFFQQRFWHQKSPDHLLFQETYMIQFSSVQVSHSVVSDSLRLHGLQHTRPPCPLPIPRVYTNSCPLSQWRHPTISSCRPLLLLPSIFPSIGVFSTESALCNRWPKYWSFSFYISPSNEHPGLISFRMDWLDLLAVRDSQESSPTPQFKSINSSALSFLHSPTLTSIHDHWKNHSLD